LVWIFGFSQAPGVLNDFEKHMAENKDKNLLGLGKKVKRFERAKFSENFELQQGL
jgi:hypothetical protein